MPAKERASLTEAVNRANVANRARVANPTGASLKDNEKAGVAVVRLSRVERALFRKPSRANDDSGLMPADSAPVCIVQMLLSIFVQCLARHGFNALSAWTQEIARHMMAWAAARS